MTVSHVSQHTLSTCTNSVYVVQNHANSCILVEMVQPLEMKCVITFIFIAENSPNFLPEKCTLFVPNMKRDI